MKRTILLLLAIVLIGFGWSGAWYFVEGKVLQIFDETTTRFANRGQEISCIDRESNGFPFRIGISCKTFRFNDFERGFSFKSGEVKSVAQAYQPNKVVMEISDPFLLKLPSGQGVNANWKSMRGSAKVGLSGPDRFSIVGTGLSVLPIHGATAPSQLGKLQIHGRKLGENDAQLAVIVDEFDSDLTTFPVFDATVSVLLEEAYRALIKRPDVLALAKKNGLNGTVETFRYSPKGAGHLEVRGPFELKKDGLLSGDFQLSIVGGSKVLESLGMGIPRYKQQFEQAGKAVSLLAKTSSNGEVKLPLTVTNGNVSLGIVPVGKIERLF